MPKTEKRRSPRRALETPIRVFGTDVQGRDFVEDSTTWAVSRHGAKIQLTHKLFPDQEILILCQGNNREAHFRVVRQAGEPTSDFSFWGLECLEPGKNIWEGALPISSSKPAPRPVPQPGPKTSPRPAPPLEPNLASRPVAKRSSEEILPTQAVLRCSKCGMRELVELDEKQIQTMRRTKGLVRDCPACGATSLWKRLGAKRS
jgi:hypothetical protein